MTLTSFYSKQCLQIVADYRAAGGAWPPKKAELSEWALANGRWKPSREDVRRMCGEALTEAMREATITDETGREVRYMLPATMTRNGEQGTFWDDLRTAPVAHVRTHVAQRRNAIVAECFQLYNVVRYSNEHRDSSEQIQISLDFLADVHELDQPVTKAPIRVSHSSGAANTESLKQSAPPRPSAPSLGSPNARRRLSSRPSSPA